MWKKGFLKLFKHPSDGTLFLIDTEMILKFVHMVGTKFHMENALKHGAVAFKSGLAYQREISYESALLSAAQEEFDQLFSYRHMGNYLPTGFTPGKNFQNFMMHRILRFANTRNFPNVFIDMCWAHIISPEASIRALTEWIDAVPVNKISAFGGDYLFIDGVYGHLCIARENVSRSLAEKVSQGVLDTERAKQIADMPFFENPKELFQLNDIK